MNLQSETPSAIYVHIPFCIQKCNYCDFAVYIKSDESSVENYLKALTNEIKARFQQQSCNSPLKSLYFGGGTPSLLSPKEIATILEEFHASGVVVSSETEVTLEINPGTLTGGQIQELQDLGVNRWSVGVQTFNKDVLRFTKRKHSAQDTLDLLENLANSPSHHGFSVDLLIGLPGQSPVGLRSDLEIVKTFGPNHLSCYVLTVDEGHFLNSLRLGDEIELKMLHNLIDACEESGLRRYEISNFARPGRESKHNLAYWTDQNYLGLGLSAHSFVRNPSFPFGVRFWNSRSLREYLQFWSGPGAFVLPENQVERLSTFESLFDRIHTGLRLTQGIDLAGLSQRFGPELAQRAARALARLSDKHTHLLSHHRGSLRLTDKGRDLSHLVDSLIFDEIKALTN